jgi:CheY-like chemotaxis protein
MEYSDGLNIQHQTILKHPDTGLHVKDDTRSKKPVVLVAEDEEVNIIYIRYVYSKLNIELIIASSGIEAVEYCRQNSAVSLILMDIRMPEMNGVEATMEIRKFNKEVPIYALTAYGHSGEESRVLEAGCTGYLTKPISRETLVALVNKYIVSQQ